VGLPGSQIDQPLAAQVGESGPGTRARRTGSSGRELTVCSGLFPRTPIVEEVKLIGIGLLVE
jgi:hypothetical protein